MDEEDRAFVAGEIASSIKALRAEMRPRGYRRVLHWLRDSGFAVMAWTVPLTLLGFLITAIGFAVSESKNSGEFRGSTEARLNQIDIELKEIRTSLTSLRLSQITNYPITKATASQVKEVIDRAKKESIDLDPQSVAAAGYRLAAAAEGPGPEWTAATSLVSYASTLRKLNSLPSEDPPSGWTFDIPGAYSPQEITGPGPTIAGSVSIDKAAVLQPIAKPDLNAKMLKGPRIVVLFDGEARIDGLQMKHVTFVRTLIRYSGGPLKMDDVVFVDCTFDVPPKENGKKFLEAAVGVGGSFLNVSVV